MDDKQIFYSILSREIDNLIGSINPTLGFLSNGIKNYVINFIDPYVNLFLEGKNLNVDMASSFLEEEVKNKINCFKEKYKEELSNER